MNFKALQNKVKPAPQGWLDGLFSLRRTTTIPLFPEFKSIEFSDKEHFERFVHQFDLYSDFNFNSFHSWDADGVHAVSELNNNLVLRFADYITGEPFYSFIGTNRVADTTHTLLEYMHRQGLGHSIKLVPEVTVSALETENDFIVLEDPDNFDYIFSISNLAELKGKTFKSKRQAAKKCESNPDITVHDYSQINNASDVILATANRWAAEKDALGKEIDMATEQIAIERILKQLTEQDSLLLNVAKHNNEIVGFSVDELLPNKYVLSHYFKALPTISGLSEYLNQEVARLLQARGFEFWNWEQNLGLESLKRMKASYRPIDVKRKYIIKKVRGLK